MKKQYSQLIAPFKRVTNEPIELDYIFGSYDELLQWTENNMPILHEGLLKVVTDESGVTFYSFKKKDDNQNLFEPFKLINPSDIPAVESDIKKLVEQIKAIWGVSDPSNIDEKYNSIAKLAERIKYINDQISILKTLSLTDKALAGYSGDDIIQYLATLKYGSVTALNNALDSFLTSASKNGQPISTWKDLQTFLTGYTAGQQLQDIILEITGGKLNFVDSETVSVEVLEMKDSIRVKHSVKIGTGVTDTDLNNKDNNFIIVKNGGIFYNLTITDDGSALLFKCNGNIVKIFKYAEKIEAIVDEKTEGVISVKDTYYDQSSEQIVIVFSTKNGDKFLRIPMSIVIREWDVNNSAAEPVKLNLQRAVGDGKDILSATLEVSTDTGNLAQKRSNGLYVSNNAKNLAYNETTVHNQFDLISAKQTETDSRLSDIENTINEKFEELKSMISEQVEAINARITSEVETINAKITSEIEAINKTISDNVSEINEKINSEVARLDSKIDENATLASDELEKAKEELNNTITAKFEELDEKITSADEALRTLVSDSIATHVKEQHTWIGEEGDEIQH